MKLQNKILTNLAATALVLTTTTASALPSGWHDVLPAWSATASSCSLDESSTGKSEFSGTQFRYLGSAVSSVRFVGTFPFATLVTTPITVRCNVTPIYDFQSTGSARSAFWNHLIVGYKDPDGISTKAQVLVSLRKVSRATQGETTIATFNSNTSNNVVANEDVAHFKFNENPDFQNNAYYVEINLIRTDVTVATPIVYTVRLANGDLPPP